MGDRSFQPLKNFLKRDALDFHRANIAKTYVCVREEANSSRVIGFVALTCSEVYISDGRLRPSDGGAARYRHFPAVKVVRLAVDRRERSCGVGRRLLDLSISIARRVVMPSVGCRFLMVDAKPEAIAYYENFGFTLLDTKQNRKKKHPVLFIDLHKL